ncbi:uncharacterized protein LOC142323780 isoform X2 [Lycorma delicatula]
MTFGTYLLGLNNFIGYNQNEIGDKSNNVNEKNGNNLINPSEKNINSAESENNNNVASISSPSNSYYINNNNSLISLSIIGVLIIMSALPSVISAQKSFLTSQRKESSPYKGFSGLRVRSDSLRMVYAFDQTVAVVEIGPNRELYNCELIEIYKPKQGIQLLKNLTSEIGPHVKISFDQMVELMDNCQLLDTHMKSEADEVGRPARGFHTTTPSTILSGILPGTKWCGSGDLADTYFDLGYEKNLDKCCRTHDICPSKVRPGTTRYDLTNNAIYTKSHCTCDLNFMRCLKNTNNPTANLMGNFYFNILRVPCLNTTTKHFQTANRY